MNKRGAGETWATELDILEGMGGEFTWIKIYLR